MNLRQRLVQFGDDHLSINQNHQPNKMTCEMIFANWRLQVQQRQRGKQYGKFPVLPDGQILTAAFNFHNKPRNSFNHSRKTTKNKWETTTARKKRHFMGWHSHHQQVELEAMGYGHQKSTPLALLSVSQLYIGRKWFQGAGGGNTYHDTRPCLGSSVGWLTNRSGERTHRSAPRCSRPEWATMAWALQELKLQGPFWPYSSLWT